jgi:hypothetical protein
LDAALSKGKDRMGRQMALGECNLSEVGGQGPAVRTSLSGIFRVGRLGAGAIGRSLGTRLGCRAWHLAAPTLAGPGTLSPCEVARHWQTRRRVGPRSPKDVTSPKVSEDLARAAAGRTRPSALADCAACPNQRREWKQRAIPSLIAADHAGGCGRVAPVYSW